MSLCIAEFHGKATGLPDILGDHTYAILQHPYAPSYFLVVFVGDDRAVADSEGTLPFNPLPPVSIIDYHLRIRAKAHGFKGIWEVHEIPDSFPFPCSWTMAEYLLAVTKLERELMANEDAWCVVQ